jgi:hypothetical protein
MLSFEEFKDNFSTDFKMDLVETIFCLNYIYDLSIKKIKFLEQNKPLLNLSIGFEQGNNLINSTTPDLYNIFNYYFLDHNVLKNKNLAKFSELEELDYSLRKIQLSENLILNYGVKSLEIGSNIPILYKIFSDLILEPLYNLDLNINDFQILFEKILLNKNLKVNHPDLKTILALHQKVDRMILNYIKNSNTKKKNIVDNKTKLKSKLKKTKK